MKVRLSKRSEVDLEEIGDYIAMDSPMNAVRFIDELRVACQKIGHMPTGYQPRPELGEGLRSSTLKSYTIFFVVELDEVLVIRILHGARDIAKLDFEATGNT
ncbi:type II toxin-antitoxin system RelE/ParE family toxin [Ideonella sp.]|uniref:type II toxin-antitoxin system RelE/ParE family toxin n=1 Tax=Ideonella sp. TaxID=1929293 RepID=UPI003BB7DABC